MTTQPLMYISFIYVASKKRTKRPVGDVRCVTDIGSEGVREELIDRVALES